MRTQDRITSRRRQRMARIKVTVSVAESYVAALSGTSVSREMGATFSPNESSVLGASLVISAVVLIE